ncbi:hypothetical protein PCURB6_27920 [Paenibacillus curdlanolyticus]|nr:hypothetical protein PCURB6_27920 [Paenibacillus curdlanolyticus]
MLKIQFECKVCKCTYGKVIAWNEVLAMECMDCGRWEEFDKQYSNPEVKELEACLK